MFDSLLDDYLLPATEDFHGFGDAELSTKWEATMATEQEPMKRIKAAVKELEAKDAARLAIDLCCLSSTPLDFAEAQLRVGEDPLQSYKNRIETGVFPTLKSVRP